MKTNNSYQYHSDAISGISKEYLDGDMIEYGFVTTHGKSIDELLANGTVTTFINDVKCGWAVNDLPDSLYALVRMDLRDLLEQNIANEQDFLKAE